MGQYWLRISLQLYSYCIRVSARRVVEVAFALEYVQTFALFLDLCIDSDLLFVFRSLH